MALLATRRVASLAPSAVRRAARTLTPAVRAFKDDATKQQHDSAPAPAGEKKLEVVRPQEQAVVAPRHEPALRVRSLFDQMEREMDALSHAFFGDAFAPMLSPFSSRRRRGGTAAAAADPFAVLESLLPVPRSGDVARAMRLAADVSEDEKGYVIKADVPGMAKDNVKVRLDDGVLTISGERDEEKRQEEEGMVKWVERSHGRFVRSFALPDNVDADAISASVKDGVLEVTVPKRAEARPAAKEIAVE